MVQPALGSNAVLARFATVANSLQSSKQLAGRCLAALLTNSSVLTACCPFCPGVLVLLGTRITLQAAKRRAVAELIFFAGTNDAWRCKQLAGTWNINVSNRLSGICCSPGSHDAWHAG
jgi:hypothetical protein